MESLGLAETRRGQGTFVDGRDDLMEEIRTEMLSELVHDFVEAMQSLGCEQRTALQLVAKRFNEVNQDG